MAESRDVALVTVDIERRGYGRRYTALPVDERGTEGFVIECRGARLGPERYDVRVGDLVRWRAGAEYLQGVVRRVVRVCAPGARLYCVTNHTGITRDRLRKLVREGARAEGVELARLTDGPEPADFPSCGERSGRAKSVIAELETGAGEVRYPHEWSHTGSPARSHHGSFVGSGVRRPRDPRRRGG